MSRRLTEPWPWPRQRSPRPARATPLGDLQENVADWVTAHGAEITAEDVEMALEAVERVAGDESELAELWDDADEPEWRESRDDLTERLRAALH